MQLGMNLGGRFILRWIRVSRSDRTILIPFPLRKTGAAVLSAKNKIDLELGR